MLHGISGAAHAAWPVSPIQQVQQLAARHCTPGSHLQRPRDVKALQQPAQHSHMPGELQSVTDSLASTFHPADQLLQTSTAAVPLSVSVRVTLLWVRQLQPAAAQVRGSNLASGLDITARNQTMGLSTLKPPQLSEPHALLAAHQGWS